MRDLLWQVDEFMFNSGYPISLDIRARCFRGDNFNARGPRARVGLVSLVVVPMEMSVDNVAYGLVSDLLNLLDERARRRRLGVRINDQHSVPHENDRCIAIQFVGWLRDCRVYAISHQLNVK